MGRVILSGTSRKITFGTLISDLSIGSIVKMKVNGVATDFLIVNQGIPSNSNLYDSSCNGTWLLMKDCYKNRQWNITDINSYEISAINSYLNDEFTRLFESNIQKVIKQVKIPYHKNGFGGSVQSGANGLSCKIFLLGGYEVGFTTSDDSYFPVDGAKLSYFDSGFGQSALNKRIANWNGSANYWWLRSPHIAGNASVWHVYTNGSYTDTRPSLPRGIRPALILPSTTSIDKSGMVIG